MQENNKIFKPNFDPHLNIYIITHPKKNIYILVIIVFINRNKNFYLQRENILLKEEMKII